MPDTSNLPYRLASTKFRRGQVVWWMTMFDQYRCGTIKRVVYCRKRESYALVSASNGVVIVNLNEFI